jgi:methylated-DNA-[protein]-cysteine S-methyltransferase
MPSAASPPPRNAAPLRRTGPRHATWRVDRLGHPALPLVFALDEDDLLVWVGLRAKVDGLAAYAQRHRARLQPERRRTSAAKTELREYLAGERRKFTLELRPLGTAFQCAVWEALGSIPYGHTCSYAELAQRIGTGRGARAVGRANSCNPLPIVLPCHRVIGAAGDLVGFGGGLPTKRWLLQLEQHREPPSWRPDHVRQVQLGLFG